MDYRYRLAGFELASELALPLPACPSGSVAAQPPVRVSIGEAPPLPAPVVQRLLLEVASDDYWLEIPGVARYRVRGGNEIVVQVAPSASLRAVAAYLCSYALAALCSQRGLLAVHAAAVTCSGRAVLLLGPSGCGKSMLGACLVARGGEVLCDDLCIIDATGASALVQPSADRLALWADCAEQLGYPVNESQQPIGGVPKFSVAVGCGAAVALPVHLVLVLREAHPPESALRLTALRPLDALASLAKGAGLTALLQGMRCEQRHLEHCCKVLTQARCWQLTQCVAFSQLPRAVQLIEQLVAGDDAAQCGTRPEKIRST